MLQPEAQARQRAPWIVVVALTAVAFALRAKGMTQSLALDEAYTFREVQGHTLGALLSQVGHIEANPPLYYVVAWTLSRLGSHAVWIRMPSLVLGTGAVPLVFVLGRRTVGTWPGVVAAALLAINPFAMFFANEGRAYAMLMFLSALSTIVLLHALGRRSARWWVLYGLIATAVAYTHYAGVFVLIAQALWAAWTHRGQWRSIAASNGLVVLACLPWYLTAAQPTGIAEIYGGRLHPHWSSLDNLLGVFPGQPYSHAFRPALGLLPGRRPLILIAAGLLLAIALALGAHTRRQRRAAAPRAARSRSQVGLLVLLAVSSPLGIFLYSVTRHNVFLSRYFTASLPALLLLVGLLLTAVPAKAAMPAMALLFTGLLVGTIKELKPEYARPSWDGVVRYITMDTRRTDPVVAPTDFAALPLSIYLHGRRHVYADTPLPGRTAPIQAERVAVVVESGVGPGAPLVDGKPEVYGPSASCFHPTRSREFAGIIRLKVLIYDDSGLCVYFGPGFGFPVQRRSLRWTIQPTARIVVVNRFHEPRRVTISASLFSPPRQRVVTTVRSGRLLIAHARVTGMPLPLVCHLLVPPGATKVVTVEAHARPSRTVVALHFGPRLIRFPFMVYLGVGNLSVATSDSRGTMLVG